MVMTTFGYKDFLRLVEGQFLSSDFDAEHPAWIELFKQLKLDKRSDEALWLSFLYMAFYDEASAWVVFNNSDPFTVPTEVDFPIGMNRRNLFGGRINRHFQTMQTVKQQYPDWPTHNFTGDLAQDWSILVENLGMVWGNGRFGSYTTAEMFQKVNGIPVTITGFDNKDSSGPADGIQRLYKCSQDIETLDLYAEKAYQKVLQSGLKPSYTEVDRGVVESVLCNFSGTCRGKFYSGRNVDRQQQRIMRVEAMGYDLGVLWELRKKIFRRVDLGEYNGWDGINKSRLTHYKETGEMLWSNEKR